MGTTYIAKAGLPIVYMGARLVAVVGKVRNGLALVRMGSGKLTLAVVYGLRGQPAASKMD